MKLLLKLLLVFCLCAEAQAEVAVPPLKARVTDLTGTLSADQRAALEKGLQIVEARHGSQIVVLMVPTTQPETIEQYSIRVAEAWKRGDNDLLLLVVKDDHKVRIEVGRGLEGVIPNEVAQRVIDETIAPLVNDGEYMRGIVSGLFRLEALIGKNPQQSVAVTTLPGGMEIPHFDSYFNDLSETISSEQSDLLRKTLEDYWDRNAIRILVLVVPTPQPENISQLATRTLNLWSSRDNLDERNSVLLLVSKNESSAQIVVGSNYRHAITDEAGAVVTRSIQPLLEKGDLLGGIQTGIQQIENLLVNQKIPLGERIVSTLYDMPTWLIITLIVVATALRWFMGPILGGLTMGGVVGCGAWFVFESVDVGIVAGVAALIFVLVGLMNWIAIGLSSSSGGSSGSGGGFSGGGGGFGGGGASGSW